MDKPSKPWIVATAALSFYVMATDEADALAAAVQQLVGNPGKCTSLLHEDRYLDKMGKLLSRRPGLLLELLEGLAEVDPDLPSEQEPKDQYRIPKDHVVEMMFPLQEGTWVLEDAAAKQAILGAHEAETDALVPNNGKVWDALWRWYLRDPRDVLELVPVSGPSDPADSDPG